VSVALAIYCAVVLVGTLLAGAVYRRVWIRHRGPDRVPTGFGALLAPVLLGVGLVAGASVELVVSLVVIVGATLIYWLDDAVELSARLRLLVAFVTGIALCAAYLVGDGVYGIPLLVVVLLAFGAINVALTNLVNFYDGADLNLAIFIALSALFILLFMPMHSEWAPLAFAMLAFVFPFGLMNRHPRTIYLGDSGSFAFAGVLTLMAIAFFEDFGNLPPEAAIPAALPALDVAFVFTIRVWERHDLLSRNYMHLYQRLNRRFRGFGYLAPQLINAGLCLGAAITLQWFGAGRIVSVIAAMIGVTVPFYFACRHLFLAGPVEGPLHESRS
jgi:UDP-N-acetylmuramyl pentapeptide phosphotransferase/UDP-N-acetylglucosamine-1-phosphate transferase